MEKATNFGSFILIADRVVLSEHSDGRQRKPCKQTGSVSRVTVAGDRLCLLILINGWGGTCCQLEPLISGGKIVR